MRDWAGEHTAEEHLEGGRRRFVWEGRVRPIGLPLAAGAAAWGWHRRRSAPYALVAAATVLGLTILGAEVEFEVRRTGWRRMQLAERRRRRDEWRLQEGM